MYTHRTRWKRSPGANPAGRGTAVHRVISNITTMKTLRGVFNPITSISVEKGRCDLFEKKGGVAASLRVL